jgi:tRNA U34 5-methylaminomethyl-2-thiouridine-forming methyltransferase MnmC
MQQLITTSDGSHSLYDPRLDEHYHSIHGAIQEARHVYIEAGMNAAVQSISELNILEMGLGTGLNALLTCMEASVQQRKVSYTAIEAFPLTSETLDLLNYTELLGEGSSELFGKIHQCSWETENSIGPYFLLKKLRLSLQDFSPTDQEGKFDVIYFDAFGPRVQPELWEQEIFEKMIAVLKPGGILVTYCAKGQVKRNLKAAGFIVETLQGPPGKREMVRGRKI